MYKRLAIVVLGSLLIFSSCKKENTLTIIGGGNTAMQNRAVSSFTGIETMGQISVGISQSNMTEVILYGFENLLQITETVVENGILKIKFNSAYSNVVNSNMVAFIRVPHLNYIANYGNENMEMGGFLNGTSLNAKLYGSGDIKVLNSKYLNASLQVVGSGNIEAKGLVADTVSATIHGSGFINISPQQKLNATIYGSGNINYWGFPVVETMVYGSGRIIRR